MVDSKGERRTDVDMQIIDLLPENKDAVRQAVTLLFEVFKEHHPNAWPTMEAAMEEVKETFGENRISRVAVDSEGLLLGWIAGSGAEHYQGKAWELHPLVVRPEWQGRGLGSVLVADLEDKVRQRGGCAIWLGTDDENNQTTLGGVDLYPNILERLANIRNLNLHPYEFYLKVGFSIVGALPDANGPGKPDIFMAKRVEGSGG